MKGSIVTPALSAERFMQRLEGLRAPVDLAKAREFFRTDDEFLGARMGDVFALAREFIEMPPGEIDVLLASPVHEARVGALSIMGKQAARKKTTPGRRKELYELYLKRTDRIDTWDLVDLSAHHVVGGYLLDKPREPLYRLARSNHWWDRRIAVFATLRFIREGDLDDTYQLAELLVRDGHDLVQKVVGGVLREAGKQDNTRLLAFLDAHAAHASSVLLHNAMEHLDKDVRARYRSARRAETR